MRKVTKLAFSVLFLAIGLFASAQVSENTVKGFVYDKATGEPVMFSNIIMAKFEIYDETMKEKLQSTYDDLNREFKVVFKKLFLFIFRFVS